MSKLNWVFTTDDMQGDLLLVFNVEVNNFVFILQQQFVNAKYDWVLHCKALSVSIAISTFTVNDAKDYAEVLIGEKLAKLNKAQ